MQKNLSEKGVKRRIILIIILIEFVLFLDFGYEFFKPIMLSFVAYNFTCMMFKFSPIYKLLNHNSYIKKEKQ